ncbi:MAG: tetratricopeptide repeat protein [Armatimonadota bacterium]
MLKCETCHTPNFDGDRFCRQCGISLSPPAASGDPRLLADGETERLLRQAFSLLDQNADEDALAQVHAVLAMEPDCAPAHSALSVILERQGKTKEARQALERAVELDPDCEADRERLEALSPRRSGAPLTPVQLGLACAVPSAVLVLGVGLTLARGLQAAPPERAGEDRLAPISAVSPGNTPGPVAETPPAALAANTPAASEPAANVPSGSVAFGAAPAVPPPVSTRSSIPFGAGLAGGERGSFPRLPAPGETRPAETREVTRIGLPEVIHQPRRPAGEGLPPAGIGEVVPLHAPPPAPQPYTQGGGAPVASGPAVPVPGPQGPAVGAPEQISEKPVARRELPEPETGFIKIGPAGSARRRPPQPPESSRSEAADRRTQGPSISIQIQRPASPGPDPGDGSKR